MKNMWTSGRAELLPGEGGTTMFHLKDDNVTPGLSPMAHNPDTGKLEDTLSIYRSDVQALSAKLPSLVDSPANISVNPVPPAAVSGSPGIYWLNRNGARLTIGLGQTLHVPTQGVPEVADMAIEPGTAAVSTPTKEVNVPADANEARTFLQGILPDNHWVLVPNDKVAPSGFFLAYEPHFLGKAPPPVTPEQMRAKRDEAAQRLDAVTHPGVQP
jgi:hypothetical protein